MTDAQSEATGVGAAILFDTLLSLGIDDPSAFSAQEQADAVEAAVSDGRLDASHAEQLRQLGVLPQSSSG